jgi:hypothetical protein
MKVAKHTPGPWDVTAVDHSSGGSGAAPSTLFRVAFPSQKDFTGHVADKCHGDSYANARLIAAAPELLEALKLAAAQLSHYEKVAPIIIGAIAKAEGERTTEPA